MDAEGKEQLLLRDLETIVIREADSEFHTICEGLYN